MTAAIKQAVQDEEMRGNATFFSKLLGEDERISLMDLEYWIDYVQQFGVQEMIPLYDKMGPIEYRNWDVYTLLFSIMFFVMFVWFKVISFCCGMCKGSKKVKV